MNKNLTVIIGLLIVIVSVFIGLILIRSFTKNNQTPLISKTNQKNEFVCQHQNPTKSDSGIYTNEPLGFSIRPPAGWIISVECPEKNWAKVSIEAPDNKEIVSPGSIPEHYIIREFEIDVEKKDKTLSVQELEKEIKQDPFFNSSISLERIKLDNRDSLKVGEWSLGGITNIYASHNQKVYSISHVEAIEFSSVDNPKYTKEFDELVSGFRFLK